MTEHTGMQSSASQRTDDESVRRHLLMLFNRQALTTQYLTLAATGIAVVALWTVVDHALLMAWGLWMMVLATVRATAMKRFLIEAEKLSNLKPWEAVGLIGTTLGGVSWGVLGLTYDASWPTFHQVFLLVLLGGLSGVSTASYSSSLKANMTFIAGLFAPIFIRFLLEGSASSGLFNLAICALVGCLYLAGRETHKSVVENVKLRLSNERLVEDLRQTNAELNREIEHRNAAEEGLKQERKLFVTGPVVVFRWQASGGWPVLYASPNVSLWGLDCEELVGRQTSYTDYIHPDDRSSVALRGFRNPENRHRDFVEMDYRIVLPDGEIRWVFERTVPARDARGNVSSVDGYLLDITDRKVIEEELFEEKERAQVTLHSIGDGVMTTDNAPCVPRRTDGHAQPARVRALPRPRAEVGGTAEDQPRDTVHRHRSVQGRQRHLRAPRTPHASPGKTRYSR